MRVEFVIRSKVEIGREEENMKVAVSDERGGGENLKKLRSQN